MDERLESLRRDLAKLDELEATGNYGDLTPSRQALQKLIDDELSLLSKIREDDEFQKKISEGKIRLISSSISCSWKAAKLLSASCRTTWAYETFFKTGRAQKPSATPPIELGYCDAERTK